MKGFGNRDVHTQSENNISGRKNKMVSHRETGNNNGCPPWGSTRSTEATRVLSALQHPAEFVKASDPPCLMAVAGIRIGEEFMREDHLG